MNAHHLALLVCTSRERSCCTTSRERPCPARHEQIWAGGELELSVGGGESGMQREENQGDAGERTVRKFFSPTMRFSWWFAGATDTIPKVHLLT